MEFEIENYRLRATEDGKIERFWKANKAQPDRWKVIKGRKVGVDEYLQIALYLTSGIRYVYIHRLVYLANNPDFDIWDNSWDNVIDHIDRNRQNNKIENLQNITQRQNNFNKGAKGYTYDNRTNKYIAQIMVDGVNHHLGRYDTAEEAHEAYLKAKKIYHIY